jgi:uncharacterized membrane protein YdbT with pleckstrin-like domain
MSFIEKSLMPGEEIKFRTKYSQVLPVVATIFFGLGGIGVIAFAQNLLTPIGAIVIGLTILYIPLSSWLKYLTSEFVVTNRRVLIKVGVLRRRSFEMLLSKIESIKLDQGFLERILFGMGKIVIVGSGGSLEVFQNIENPVEFRRQIQIQIEGGEKGSITA